MTISLLQAATTRLSIRISSFSNLRIRTSRWRSACLSPMRAYERREGSWHVNQAQWWSSSRLLWCCLSNSVGGSVVVTGGDSNLSFACLLTRRERSVIADSSDPSSAVRWEIFG